MNKREGLHYDLQHDKYLKWAAMECNFPNLRGVICEIIFRFAWEGVGLSEIGLGHNRLLTNCLGSGVKIKAI